MSPLLPGLLLVLSCQGGCGADPELKPVVEAAERYDQARAALDAGQHTRAAELFAQAAELDPSSPVLLAWQARALELGGDDGAALDLVERALGRFPEDPELRYARAALLARTGDLDGAAAALHLLINQGQLSPQEAATDPDLQLLRQRPELAALVPSSPLRAELHGEQGSVLLGERYVAELFLTRPAQGTGLEVRAMGEPTGLLRRTRVVEDLLAESQWQVDSRIELTWQAVAAGSAQAGPWLLAAGGSSSLTERMTVDVLAVGQRVPKGLEVGPEDPVVPSVIVGERQPPWAGELQQVLSVLAGPTAQVLVQDGAGQEVEPAESWELRRSGQPQWVLRRYPELAAGQVKVLGPTGQVQLEQAWP